MPLSTLRRLLSEAAALMELVLLNNQGELSPLEIGLHCLKAVPTEKGGRGKAGGLSEYARRVGRTHVYIVQLRHAAEVLLACQKHVTQVTGFLDKAKHLAAVHRLPRKRWPEFVQWIAAEQPTVVEVEAAVAEPIKRRARHRKAEGGKAAGGGRPKKVTEQIREAIDPPSTVHPVTPWPPRLGGCGPRR